MKHLGHIEITDKVNFVYYELKKPDITDYEYPHHVRLNYDQSWEKCEYLKELERYEASKRTVEVSNKRYFNSSTIVVLLWNNKPYKGRLNINGENRIIFDNQPCKAEVNGTAIIIELIK